MARADANCTSEASRRWRERIMFPDYRPPRFEQHLDLRPGSKRLVLGEWVEVGAQAQEQSK